MKEIAITCKSKYFLDYKDITDFQGDVKSHNDQEVEHIIKSILYNGFAFPIFIWKSGKKNYCLDGHGRLKALATLEDRDYIVPKVPVVYIEATNEQEARRKLVEVNNLNGDFVESIFSQMVTDLDLDLLDYNIPGLDLAKIDKQLHLDDDIEEKLEVEVEKIPIICPECQFKFEVEA
jgi:DNA-dependent RNA polymerase auxiliary subunit epsilon